MAIRKKLSQRFNKSTTAGPEPQPPVPSSLPLKTLPTFPSGLPLLEPSPRFSSSTNRAITQSHRRSRSFSDLTPPRTFGPYIDSSFSRISQSSGLSIDQPWRSQDTWKALHSPTLPPSESSYGGLTHPSALLSGSGGWRSRAGEGFFATGSKTPRLRRKALEEDEESDIGGQGALGEGARSNARGKVQYRIHPGTPATSSPLATRNARPALAAAFTPKFGLDTDSDVDWPVHSSSRHHRDESLLPPLLPSTIAKSPLRSSSFTSLRSVHEPSISPSASPGLCASSLSMAPIPWGRRTPAERSSLSPTLPQTPQPRAVRRAPQRSLPSPPAVEYPLSSETEHRNSGLSSVEEAAYDTEDEFNREGSVSPIRERLTTPVTPPQTAVPERRRGDGMVLPKRWDSLGRTTEPSRQASWGTLSSNQSRVSRGGWI